MKIDKTLGASRYEICEKCEFFWHKTKQCSKCKCFMKLKTIIVNQKCPVEKW